VGFHPILKAEGRSYGWAPPTAYPRHQIDYGRIAGLNREAIGACLMDVRAATNFRGAEKSRVWLGVDILWPDGETEVVKGFITEHDAAKWIAEHSKAWQGNTNDKSPQTH
jgi:hypothetical protein